MKSIVVWTRKGGVGKTTLATHLAWHCADVGHRVRVIDLDVQGNASDALASATRLGDSAILFGRSAIPVASTQAPGTIALLAGTEALNDVERLEPQTAAASFRDYYALLEAGFDIVIVDGPALPFRVDNRLASNRATLATIAAAYGRYLLPSKVSMRHAIGQVAVHRRPVWADRAAADAGTELRTACELLVLRMRVDGP